MIRPPALFVFALVLIPATGRASAQTPNPQPSITLPADLDVVLRNYERQWAARSAEGLADLFTADGFVLQPGKPPVRGRGAIIEAYRGSGGPLALRALAYAVSDTVGYIVGAYAGRAGDPDAGKFILLVRRERGKPWKIAADMDNPNQRR